jgi:hypothetical protein
VVDRPVDHRGGDDLVAEDLTPGGEGLLLVTIRLARSSRLETSENIRLAAWASKGM